MASEILGECKALDAAGTGALGRAELLLTLEQHLPSWQEEDEMLLTPWGEQVKYEAFLAWLFKAKASLAPSGSFKVALFSSAPYDKAWFDKTNQDLAMGIEFRYFEEQLTLETTKLASGCDAVCTFVNDFAGAEVVEKLSQAGVRLIALRCAGFDRVDLEAAQKNGVTVARVPAYSPYAVGEHAVALLLSLNRHIARAYRNSRMGNFKLAGLLGQDLAGKRVGIIGTGLIGSIAARVLKKGFDCEVVAYDVFENPKIKNPEPEGLGIPYMDLDALLASCDFISLHAPLLPTTKHMINEERLKIMKKGIMIVNTSRGGLIDTNALIKGLRQGIIAGAALDVVEGEAPYFFRDHSGSCITDPNIALLLRMPNVILTPHLAFFTREALATIAETTLKSLAGVRDGAGPPKQNGTLDTVCRPAASSSKTPQVERMERMELMAALPDPAPPLKAADFPPLENTGAPFKVAVFSAREHDIEEFQQANEDFGGNFTFCFHSAQLCLDTVDLVRGADAVCIFVHDDCSAPVLQLLREGGVKMVALRCAGFNNVDLEAAARLGVAVARVPAYSTCAVAEHAAALVASVVRCIPQAVENTRRCNFALNGLLGFDMIGKTVGIIGTGLTGSISARIFKQGYGCEVIANDVVENPKVKDAAPDGLGIAYVSQEEIFSRSDIILLHAPLLRETHKIINAEAIQKMKRGVIIVNTSRGGLIDTKALIQGLREGIVGGAGLDVLAEEEEYFFHNWSNKVLLNDELSVLSCFNNVVITAHQAFFTREALLSICHTTLSNLNAARNGLEPPMQRGKYPTLLTK